MISEQMILQDEFVALNEEEFNKLISKYKIFTFDKKVKMVLKLKF